MVCAPDHDAEKMFILGEIQQITYLLIYPSIIQQTFQARPYLAQSAGDSIIIRGIFGETIERKECLYKNKMGR